MTNVSGVAKDKIFFKMISKMLVKVYESTFIESVATLRLIQITDQQAT